MRTLFGGLLLAIGVLIAGASGLCSLTVLFSAGSTSPQMWGSGLIMVAIFGGIPFAIGVGLIYAGRALIREDQNDGA
ncbi:hypothetical protein [Sphingomonas oryzagri]